MQLPPRSAWTASRSAKRNLIDKEEMPYSQGLYTPAQKSFTIPGDYALLLEKTLKAARWDELQEKLRRRRKNGEKVGVGVAMFVEKSWIWSIRYRSHRCEAGWRHRGDHRCRFRRPGRGNSHCTNMCRYPWRRLREYPRRPRPDRPDCPRHGRIRLARDGDVRKPRGLRRPGCAPGCCRRLPS